MRYLWYTGGMVQAMQRRVNKGARVPAHAHSCCAGLYPTGSTMAKPANPQQGAQATAPAAPVATPQAAQPAQAPQPVQAAPAPQAAAPMLYMGKPPALRAGHNAAAWAAITPLLPATAATLAALPAVKACGGSKANGLLMVGYCLRRGWLTTVAPAATPPATTPSA